MFEVFGAAYHVDGKESVSSRLRLVCAVYSFLNVLPAHEF